MRACFPRLVVTSALLLLVACGTDPDVGADTAADDDTVAAGDILEADAGSADVAPQDTGPPPKVCNTAAGELPPGLVELAWDDDGASPASNVPAHADWEIVGQVIKDAVMYEAVRFDLPRAAKIWGFKVRYGAPPANPTGALVAGLFHDFGHNGFDFWTKEPLWYGKRCADEMMIGEWLTFAFDEPVETPHSGLVYVAQLRTSADSPAWAFDTSAPPDCTDPNNCCNKFTACHSAWNFPELTNYKAGGQQYYSWNGLSMSRPYDYAVRLLVEYGPEVKPEERWLQPVADVNSGSHQSWGDYDGDGWDDLLADAGRLLRNINGELVDVSESSGLKALGVSGTGGVWGDFDNDGCLDLFAFRESPNQSDLLLRNTCKGADDTFEDVTAKAGITDVQSYNLCNGDPANDKQPSPAATWIDLDNDGLLDLYVANFICWAAAPETFYADQVWHNEGDGVFKEWTGTHGFFGFDGPYLAGRTVSAADADGDGMVDIVVGNYRLHRNFFYQATGGGQYQEKGMQTNLSGTPFHVGGAAYYYGHTIGTAWGDLDGDGDLDLVEANLAHPRFFSFSNKTRILLNDGKGTFNDIQGDWTKPAGDTGLRYQETHSVPVLGDFDQDGALDLAITATYDGRPSDFYWGNGDGTFVLANDSAGIEVTGAWGMAVSDFDHDGDLDLAATGVFYRNDLVTGGRSGRTKGGWMQVGARGTKKCNRAAIGATVRLKGGDRTFVRHVSGGNGQGGQDSAVLHFGLGDTASIETIEVDFPGKGTVTVKGPWKAGRRLWVDEDGKVTEGWKAP